MFYYGTASQWLKRAYHGQGNFSRHLLALYRHGLIVAKLWEYFGGYNFQIFIVSTHLLIFKNLKNTGDSAAHFGTK